MEDRALCGLMPQCQNGARRPAGWRFGFPARRREAPRIWEKPNRPALSPRPAERLFCAQMRRCALCAGAKWGTIRVLTMRGFLPRGFL